MCARIVQVLLVEDNPTDALIVRDELEHAIGIQFDVTPAARLSEAFQQMKERSFDVVLLDLSLPDSNGLETFVRMQGENSNIPIIVLSGLSDGTLAFNAVQAGAQDYLTKGRLEERVLPRAIRYAIERKRSVEALRLTHVQLRLLLDHSPSVLLAWKIDGEKIIPHLVSENVVRLLGCSVPEAMQSSWWSGRVHPEDREIAERGIGEALAHGTSQCEYRLRHQDGAYRWINDNRRLVRNSAEAAVELVGVWMDITERKAADEALRESERFVRAALDGLTAHIAIIDERGVILAVNEAWRTFAVDNQLSAERGGEGVNYLDVCDCAESGEDGQKIGAVGAAIRDVLAGRTAMYEAEYPCHSPTEKRWFMVRITPFRGEGARRVVIAHENITQRRLQEDELRANEERFRQVVESIREVFWMRDVKEDRIIYVSPGYDAIWGESRTKLYEGPSDFGRNVRPDETDRERRLTDNEQQAGTYDETFRIVRPDGTARWIHNRAFPVRNAAGEVYRIVGVAEDVTDQRELAEQVRQAQKMESIGTLAGGIAHDFNNVLACINGYTELSKIELPKDSPVSAYMDAVMLAVKRAADLVRQIVAFSRQQELERKPLQLRFVIKEAMELLRATIPSGIAFDVHLESEVPDVLADASQVHQVIMNLCTNAAHAMQEHPGRLTIALENVAVDTILAAAHPGLFPGRYARLSVSDTGCGIGKATLGRIFDPFFTTKAPGEGTGLGLAVVHGIMQSHEGAVIVESEPDKGTRFDLYFPARARGEVAGVVPSVPFVCGRGERILYVDDEPMLVQMGKHILERLGYVVDARINSNEALAEVRAHPDAYDLVITDHMMPGLTGTALAERLRALRASLPIILTTGYNATLTDERVREMGISRLLLKPVAMETLGVAVSEVLAEAKSSYAENTAR